MSTPLLQTKLYAPPTRPELVPRPRLIERLNQGLPRHGNSFARKLTLISAPAGFGKTTLVSEWIRILEIGDWRLRLERSVERERVEENKSPISNIQSLKIAWLSLDEGDSDPTRFLFYFVAALRAVGANVAQGALGALQSPQPPPIEAILTVLINEIAAVSDQIILVLDDYHLVGGQPIHDALAFLLKRLPPHMHLVIATREDPPLPLARYRARGQLTELRAADLRFTPAQAAEFLNQVMGLNLSAKDVAALETRTEGWIAGLQLAALALQGTISMQGHKDVASFIKSFTGSHHFVLDYLVEEVLQQQSASVQAFLLRTSILDRMCGPLCDAVMGTDSSQQTLEYLERANLFIVPLDNERRWYRYHHLFAQLLRQRQSLPPQEGDVAEYHIRASQWYEQNDLELEAFRHAAAANDVERAVRMIKGGEMPLHLRSVASAILDWLALLPTTVLDARPSLWATYASLLLVTGQTTGVEEKLQAAEAALQGSEPDDETRNLVGRIAAARATLALTRYQVEAMIAQSRRALEYLHPDNLTFRTTALWTLANAYELQGNRVAAGRAYTEAISISQTSGNIFFTILATIGLGEIQALENQFYLAAETYQRVLQLAGDQPLQIISEAHLGLARILYQWNDLEAAEQHGQQGLQLARQYESVIDRFVMCEVFLARLKLAQGDVAGAAAMLAETEQSTRRNNFVDRMPEVAAARVLALLRQGDLAAAARMAQAHELPRSQARVYLAQGDPSAALAVLGPLRQQMEARGWQDELLKTLVLQAVTLHQAQQHAPRGAKDEALQILGDALALAEPGGLIRVFVDEGPPMAHLLSAAVAHGIMPGYAGKLLAAYEADITPPPSHPLSPGAQRLIEPLTPREQEVLQLIAKGLTNQEIADRLYLSLNTVKVHTRNIYSKLDAHHRAGAVAKARTLGILHPN